ncbi:MAG TPA: hypothetical protein VGF56_13735 [Rhizomicrobium sp.]
MDYTVKYYVDMSGAKAGFTTSGLNAEIAHDFSGSVALKNGTVVKITAHGVPVSKPGPGVNTIKAYKSLKGISVSGRAETNKIGGSQIKVDSSDNAAVAAHEAGGHGGGAGDQYKGGIDRNGNPLTSDVPGPPNVMRDLGGPANTQTLREILGGLTTKNICAPNVHAANSGC